MAQPPWPSGDASSETYTTVPNSDSSQFRWRSRLARTRLRPDVDAAALKGLNEAGEELKTALLAA